MIAALLILACAKPGPPPSIWPEAPPPLDPPELPNYAWVESPQDEIPTTAPILPGQVPPYVDGQCLATARGIAVPETKLVDLVNAAEIGQWYADRAQICYDHRLADRVYADALVAQLLTERQAAEAEARWLRWAAPASLAVGIVIGAVASDFGENLGQ